MRTARTVRGPCGPDDAPLRPLPVALPAALRLPARLPALALKEAGPAVQAGSPIEIALSECDLHDQGLNC